ncbi:hypothetical protein RclHR1_01830007 [Rhizophagus clarus]|uniref:Endonuclease/exonuclease/phosphatase domain-containing protein n=1 Tax=Rhizophagus clarus TaxID=94130 RepID=A0A2Z6RF81_9GLOM|nr:hypothetical protein RclHR1_01830007 [Rhizophagus clarus]
MTDVTPKCTERILLGSPTSLDEQKVPDEITPMIIDQLDDLKIISDPIDSTLQNRSSASDFINNPENFFAPTHSFLPNIYIADSQKQDNEYETSISSNGRWNTNKKLPKNLKKTLSDIKSDKKSHSSRNNSMHAPKDDNVTTFDAYINLNDIDNYFHNKDKLAYMELLARDLKGFAGVELIKEDQEIIVKNSMFKEMQHMVRMVNHRCKDHPFMKLKPKQYYLLEGTRVSSKEFKILNVPKDASRDAIEQAVITLLGSKRFFIKKSGIKPSKNNRFTNTIFITIKDLEKCNLLKNTWAIEINHHFYRFALAHASEQDLSHRKQYRGEFVSFNENITPDIVHEAYIAQNPKHIFCQSDDKYIIEFESEVDLFNACNKTVHFRDYIIRGSPCNYEINWIERKTKLAKKDPSFVQHDNIVKLTQDKESKHVKVTYKEIGTNHNVPKPPSYSYKSRRSKPKGDKEKAVPTHHIPGIQANRTPLGKPAKMGSQRSEDNFSTLSASNSHMASSTSQVDGIMEEPMRSPNIPPHYTTNTPNNIQIDNAINPQFNQDIKIFLARNHIEFELQAELHTNAAEILKNFFLSLNIATHNINGCGTEETFYKLDSLLSYMKSNNIDILTLTETNLDPFKGEALARNIDDHNFHIIFGNKQADKIKGSGTAIIISQKWFHHLYEVNKISPFITRIKLLFSKLKIWIWAVYAAPQNKQSILSEVSTLIRNDICNQKNLNQQILHLVTGDFNETLDPVMNRFSVSSHANNSNNSNNSTFFSELIRLRFSDSLRNISSTDHQYTYRHTNGSTLSRIDYIWVSDIQDVICRKYESVDITDITHSDHNLVLTELYLGDFLSINQYRQFIDNHTSLIIPTQDILSQSWTQVLRSIVKVRTYIDHKIRRSHNLKIISEKVERLFEITQSNQSEWLSKTQNKTSRRINIDRIKVKLADGSCYMELHPANIKTLTKEKLEHIVRMCNTT